MIAARFSPPQFARHDLSIARAVVHVCSKFKGAMWGYQHVFAMFSEKELHGRARALVVDHCREIGLKFYTLPTLTPVDCPGAHEPFVVKFYGTRRYPYVHGDLVGLMGKRGELLWLPGRP